MIQQNKRRVFECMKAGKVLTAMNGFTDLGIVSVRDYISMLKKDGIIIQSEWRKSSSGKRYKSYWINK
jgi:transcription initiation factor IIE alpha subunit